MPKKNHHPYIDLLASSYSSPSSTHVKKSKSALLSSLDHYDSHRMEREMMVLLKRRYSARSQADIQHQKQLTFDKMGDLIPRRTLHSYTESLVVWTKRMVALGFASILFVGTALAPFQALTPFPSLQIANAAFLECKGPVTVNGQLCDEQAIVALHTGDRIQTAKDALATLFYTDHSLVRFHEETAAVLDEKQTEVVHVEEGSLWIHSPAENVDNGVQVFADDVRLKVPKGSASVSKTHGFTELLSTTALVEVQIDSPDGKTEVVTVPPEKSLMIRNASSRFALFDGDSSRQEKQWVEENKQKDIEHLAHVKERTGIEKAVVAGSLPGGVTDYVEKATKSARTAITWDADVKIQRQLSELDELLAESLVLYQKGDQTTARTTFEAYSKKISSLVATESDKIRVKDENTNASPFVSLFKKHAQILSPYEPQDPEYVLRKNVEQLSLELETTVLATNGELLENVSKQKILDAHRSLATGQIDNAEQLLIEANDLEDAKSVVRSDAVNETVQVLNEIAQKSEQLEPLVKEIKQKKVERIKAQEPVVKEVEVLTDVVVGTAVKPQSDQPQEDDDESLLSGAIGLAVKEESTVVLE